MKENARGIGIVNEKGSAKENVREIETVASEVQRRANATKKNLSTPDLRLDLHCLRDLLVRGGYMSLFVTLVFFDSSNFDGR